VNYCHISIAAALRCTALSTSLAASNQPEDIYLAVSARLPPGHRARPRDRRDGAGWRLSACCARPAAAARLTVYAGAEYGRGYEIVRGTE